MAVFVAIFMLLPVSLCYSSICGIGYGGDDCGKQDSKVARRNSKIVGRNIPLLNVGKNIHINQSPRISTPFVQAEETYDFSNTLEGEWDTVIGYVGIQIDGGEIEGDFYACLVGLKTVPLGNNEYQSTGWDKKLLWMEVGNGIPLFIFGTHLPTYDDEGVVYDNVYYAPNIGYYDVETETSFNCDMWLYLNAQDEVEDCWIAMYDENQELLDVKQLEEGDYITTYSMAINRDEPELFYYATIEEDYQMVIEEPTFFYAHMTPNVDFSNPLTLGKIDFDNCDLYYILEGQKETDEGVTKFVYSNPKKIGIKWGNKPAKTENWFMHEVSGIMNFFLPTR